MDYQKNNDLCMAKQEPEHVKMAIEMSQVLSNFNPEQQNEAVKIIYERIRGRRMEEIQEAEKRWEYLKQTFDRLQ